MKKVAFENMIKDRVIDIPQILYLNIQELKLNESLIMMIMTLYGFEDNLFSVTKIQNKLNWEKDRVFSILDDLVKLSYIRLEVRINKEGLEEETFSLDPLYSIIIKLYENKGKEELGDLEKVSQLLEETFKKPLNPNDIELVEKWLNEDGYDLFEIESAIYDAMKSGKMSTKAVDNKLLKNKIQKEETTTYDDFSDQILKGLKDEWKK